MLTDFVPMPHRCNTLAYALLWEALGLTPSPPICGSATAPEPSAPPAALPVSLPVSLPAPPPPQPRRGRPQQRTPLRALRALRTPPPARESLFRRRAWTQKTATAALHAFVAEHGRVPTTSEWRHPTQYQIPDPGFVRRTWGHLHTWYQRLGLTPNPPPGRNQYTMPQGVPRGDATP